MYNPDLPWERGTSAVWQPRIQPFSTTCYCATGKVKVTCLGFFAPSVNGKDIGQALNPPQPSQVPLYFSVEEMTFRIEPSRPETWPMTCKVPSTHQKEYTSNPCLPMSPITRCHPRGACRGQTTSLPAIGGLESAGTWPGRVVHRVGKGALALGRRHRPKAQQVHKTQGLPMARIKAPNP